MFNDFFIEFHNRLDIIKESVDIIKDDDFDNLNDFKKEFIVGHNLKDNDDLIDFLIYSFYWWFSIYF